MSRVLACAVVLASVPVLAGPTRKPATDKYPAEAITAFVEAVIADKSGDLDVATRRYTDANRVSPQPNTYWNVAELYRRMEKPDRAVEAYQKYLELAPDAKDRKDVEKLIAQLSRETIVVLDGDDLDGVILVDGKLIGPSPAVLKLPKGSYVAERISPLSFGSQNLTVRPLATQHLRLGREQKGNVVLAGNPRGLAGSWEEHGVTFQIPGRFTLPPGKHTLSPKPACSSIVVDVPREANAVAHVFIEAQPSVTGCIPIAVKAQTLRLGAGKP